MANFDLTNLALRSVCPNNLSKVDDTGLPSVLVYIPAFKNSDVLAGGDDNTHPAFIVNGEEIPGFYYSKFQNVVHDGVAYSLPGVEPLGFADFDAALSYCEAKGHGWHLSTNAEWAAIALWCKKNGFLPYGNNYYGKDSRESNYKATPYYRGVSTKREKVATGTGPLTWSHDKTAAGIWDLNGNVDEWQGGIRLVWGELQILANNDAADSNNSQAESSTCWKAIKASDGTLVTPESKTTDSAVKTSGNTVKLDFVSDVWTYSTGITSASASSRSCAFEAMTCASTIGDAAKVLLRSLALLPDEGATVNSYETDSVVAVNSEEINYVHRGGDWLDLHTAGVFSVNMVYSGLGNASTGFRCAYIPELAGEG